VGRVGVGRGENWQSKRRKRVQTSVAGQVNVGVRKGDTHTLYQIMPEQQLMLIAVMMMQQLRSPLFLFETCFDFFGNEKVTFFSQIC